MILQRYRGHLLVVLQPDHGVQSGDFAEHWGNEATPPFAPREPVPNYLIPAVIVTLACCLPIGVVAVIYAAQVNNKLAMGDVAGAKAASSKAKMWSWIGFAVALIIPAIWLILLVVGAFSSS